LLRALTCRPRCCGRAPVLRIVCKVCALGSKGRWGSLSNRLSCAARFGRDGDGLSVSSDCDRGRATPRSFILLGSCLTPADDGYTVRYARQLRTRGCPGGCSLETELGFKLPRGPSCRPVRLLPASSSNARQHPVRRCGGLHESRAGTHRLHLAQYQQRHST